jgi:hypothetical protein
VRHAHAAVAGGDVDVFLVHRVVADVREAIDGFHALTGPAKLDLAHHLESLARPLFQVVPATIRVVVMARLVVFAADDQDVVVLTCDRVRADVVVWVERVPVERIGQRTARDAGAL